MNLDQLSTFLVRYELAIQNTRNNERRSVSANPELITRILYKLKHSNNKVLTTLVKNDRAFDTLANRLETRFTVDTSSYPTIDAILEDDSGESDDPAIISNMKFGEMQMNLNMFNNKVRDDDSDSDGFLSDDEEPLEDGDGEVIVRGRGGARMIAPVDLDIDDEDFEMDELPEELDPGERKEELRERAKQSPIKMDVIFDTNEAEEKEIILSEEEEDEAKEEFDIQKSLINEVLNSTITMNIKEISNESTETNEDVTISVEKQGDSKTDV